MTVSLKHAFTSAIADSGDTTLVQPSNWNAEHTLTLAQGNILGRTTGAGNGAAQEIPVGFDSSGHMTLPAGSASAAPLNLTSGTNLTSAAAGAIEYDGTVFYATPQPEAVSGRGALRGIIPGMQFYRIDSTRTVTSASGAFSVFGVGATVASSTVYSFEAVYLFNRTAGTTSHTVSMLFAGTATYNNFSYIYDRYASATGFNNEVGDQIGLITSAGSFTFTGARTVPYYDAIRYRGSFSCNAAGTFIPQLSYSVAPGGSTFVNPGSFILIYPIGASGANTSVGTWA